tara:strand:+ start:59 stop:496 length:438 start_codon:yes stop_codon:yes gene_type:complete
MFYSGMMGAMGGNIGNVGAVDVASVFKKRMQEGQAAAPMSGMGATLGGVMGRDIGNVAGISFDINESPKNRKMRAIRKLSETGVGGEKDAALEKLKNAGPQLPLAMGATSPGYFLGSQMGMGGGLPPMGNIGAMIGEMMGRGVVN